MIIYNITKKGDTGSPGLSNIEYVEGPQTTLNENQNVFSEIFCPGNKKVLSGGHAMSSGAVSSGGIISRSYASTPNSWRIYCWYPLPNPNDAYWCRAEAMCANVA